MIGVVSYLLINFWFTRIQANKAAILAFTMNRVGALRGRISLLCLKLSNSGDTLKLLIPSYSRKAISGQNNYLGMVTSQEMNESEMGYRGSKSEFLMNSVKEQRVDGSWSNYLLNNSFLRYTLMGGESRYQVKIPSKQLNIKKFSTLNSSLPINPWFITGLIDAEGSFSVIIDKNKSRKLGWRVQTKFQLGMHLRDILLITKVKDFFGGIGSIHISQPLKKVNYSVDSILDLTKLIVHLENYPLHTQKAADFILFKEVIILMKNKYHLSNEGLNKIVNIKASLNLGLSEFLKSEFLNFTPVERPIIKTESISDSNWVAGFVSGEGNFDVRITEQKSNKIGSRVQLRFRVNQHIRDIKLLELLVLYLGGNLYKYPDNNAVVLTIVKFSDIINKIIPYFEKNPIIGVKQLDFNDWCVIAELMKKGSHLTVEGLNLIREIKSGMNTGRK